MTTTLAGKTFALEIPGRSGMIYRENEKEVFIESEMLVGDPELVFSRNSIRFWSDGSQIAERERDRILSNVALVLREARIRFEVE